jgi:hypothetical protein
MPAEVPRALLTNWRPVHVRRVIEQTVSSMTICSPAGMMVPEAELPGQAPPTFVNE